MSGITKWDKALLDGKGRRVAAKYEATIADLNADLRQAEHERNVLRNARLCKATCRDQKERLKRENADLRDRLAAEKNRADAAEKCIEDVETYLELLQPKYIRKTINLWRGDHGTEGER